MLSTCYASSETSSKLLHKGISKKTLKLLERYEDAFDLQNGYLTCPDLQGTQSSYARLVPNAPTGTNAVFQVHAREDQPLTLPENVLAQRLLQYQLFSLDFGRSPTGSRHHSPCATSAMGIAVGQNLLETLALNLVPNDNGSQASWQLSRSKEFDFKNQARGTPKSLAERYTWVAQAVRFVDNRVITARGYKLSSLGDPMTTFWLSKSGELIPQKLIHESTFVTACHLTGCDRIAAPILAHAAILDIPYKVLCFAQINDTNSPAKLLESLEGTYSPTILIAEHARKIASLIAYLNTIGLEDAIRLFLSYFEDAIGQTKTIDFDQPLAYALEDLGAKGLKDVIQKKDWWT